MPHTFHVDAKPKAKGRPRFANGRTYTPKDTLDAEKFVASCYDGPLYTGPVAVFVAYHKDHSEVTVTPLSEGYERKAQADIDNLLKLTLDALNGVAWDDDRQVVHLEAIKCH